MTALQVPGTSNNGIGDEILDPSVSRLAAAIADEEPVMALLGTNEVAVRAVVDECIASLPDQSLRIIRIRGAQGSPLTLSRIARELGAGDRAGAPADDDELIVRMLAKPGGKHGRVILVIEQAERLPTRTLAFLQVISTVFGARTPRLQILFAGHPSFVRLIETDELAGIRDRLGTTIQIPGPPASATHRRAAAQRPNGGIGGSARVPPFFARWKKVLAPLLILAVITAGAGVAMVWRGTNNRAVESTNALAPPGAERTDPSSKPSPPIAPPPQAVTPEPDRRQQPQPGAQNPDGSEGDPAAAASPDRRRSLPNAEQLARLREEFEHFLAQTGWGSKRQSESERLRLFNEFLQWSYGGSAASNAELPPQVAALPRTRVTLHFLAGSANGEGMARRFATQLRPSVALARTRAANEVPKTFELRYFAQADEASAEALAQMLQTPEITWLVRIIPDAKPAPAPRTIELWIPLR